MVKLLEVAAENIDYLAAGVDTATLHA